MTKIKFIDANKLKPDPNQPRQHFNQESIAEMAETIKRVGIISPIIIDPDYKILIGHRRVMAAELAGLKEIPCIVKGVSGANRLELQLIEEITKENISPLEKAEAIAKLKKLKNLSNEKIAGLLGISEVHVGRILRLNNLPSEMVLAFEEGKITATDLMEIRSLDEKEQRSAFIEVMKKSGHKAEIRELIKERRFKVSRPRDYLRKVGVNIDPINLNTLVVSKNETMKHFIVKSILFKILRDMGRNIGCESEVNGGVADIIDLENHYVYEVETAPAKERIKEKIEQFGPVTDVIVIDVNELPDNINEIEWALKKKIV